MRFTTLLLLLSLTGTSLASSPPSNEIDTNYAQLKSFISELVSGKPPPFTESVYSRFNELYTQQTFVARATDAAAEAYGSFTDAAGAMMTPPPAVEKVLGEVSGVISSVINEASIAVYGTPTGAIESITSAAASQYASAASAVSIAIYGKELTPLEKAQLQVNAAFAYAQSELSVAIYGTPKSGYRKVTETISDAAAQATGYVNEQASVVGEKVKEGYEAASSYVDDSKSSASSVASSVSSVISDSVSVAFYGREKTYAESAQARLEYVLSSAKTQLSEVFYGTPLSLPEKISITAASVYAQATDAIAQNVSAAGSVLSEAASVVSESASSVISGTTTPAASSVESVFSSATEKVKEAVKKVRDEL